MRLTIDGWSRGYMPWTLVNLPFDRSNVVDESRRFYGKVGVCRKTARDEGIELRTRVTIKTSGDFDCKITFKKNEVLLMAIELLRDRPIEEVIGLLSEALQSVGEEGVAN